MSLSPPWREFSVPPGWQAIDFISDLHLSQTTPETFAAFADYLQNTSADAVFILGDLFDVWIGDDARHHGFEAQCAETLALAASQRTMAFMAGNRDFLLGADMLTACGMQGLPDPCVLPAWGKRILLSHGDALCLSDTDYQAFRHEVRSATWQQRFLTMPLAQRRQVAQGIRSESMKRHAQMQPHQFADIDGPTAIRWMHEAHAFTLVHGHTHRPGSELIAPGFLRHVLSDWDGAAQPARAEVLRLTPEGFSRLTWPQALQNPTMMTSEATHHASSS